MDKSYIYLISQWDNVTDFIIYSKTGYTDINRAQAICDRLNREYNFFAKWKEGMQAYVDSNDKIIAYKKEIDDYKTRIYALYPKQDNKSQKLCRKLDGLVVKCNSIVRKLQLILEEEWETSTDFYDDGREYLTYSVQKLKIK